MIPLLQSASSIVRVLTHVFLLLLLDGVHIWERAVGSNTHWYVDTVHVCLILTAVVAFYRQASLCVVPYP